MSSKLFTPLKIGPITLSNRLVMAPLTRFRADDAHVPLPFVKEYYAQRAVVPGTLLITEATFISPRAGGLPNVPGLWSPEQLVAWKGVTDAVHAAGSHIFVQLWALGRAANPAVLKAEGVGDVVSSSAVPMAEDAAVPRALSEAEIQDFIADYAKAAKAAIEQAGFDGVEIHGANGYLIDQFTQDTCNQRTDRWGGSIENRARFGLEVAKAVVGAVGKEKVGIRLSPWSLFQGMRMQDPVPQFTYLIKRLKELGLAYLHLVESRVSGNVDSEKSDRLDFAVQAWGGVSPVLIAGGFKPDLARRAVDVEYKDTDVAIVFGRFWISNPDLVFKIQKGIALEQYDRALFYNAKEKKGYVDYPFSKEFVESRGATKL
ncbi:NADH:flavin oxidoreductase/NADH oxidase family protein [Lepidopterella palustris CBS 459.81]|uniref:NADH:flavin oxidoreductase/NADH oxidase family protein n=1 Tax=Lepidopterella palustris CBS 459.81 TaxID=1314670 RepID=A0A8E2E905_9PEZI|nr:NADH:flavin oxidoreductase/NADH oxidase family protein [Lepidopterella palustris CBS 459.81]